jgi:hypothetical protein
MTEVNKTSEPLGLASTAELEPGACICRTWCRSDLGGVVIDGRRYPGPNHADGCPAQVREPFTMLEYDGGRVVMEPHEAAQMQDDAPPNYYTASTVMLTRDQFNRMPEFPGF